MRRKQRNHSAPLLELFLERLELRTMLAGNAVVDVNGNNLTIRGDKLDNSLELYVTDETIRVAGFDNTTLVGDAAGSGDDFDTGIAAKSLGKLKLILKTGNDRIAIADAIQLNGKSTISLAGGDDEFLIDGANGNSKSNFTIRGSGGNDLVEFDGWSFEGKTNVALGGGDDTLGVSVSSTSFGDQTVKLNGGGGVDELAPLAKDSDFGAIPVGVNLVVTADNLVNELTPTTVGIESLGVVQKSFEVVPSDANLTAADVTFNSATINGVPTTSLADVGFSYTPGSGDGGTITFAIADAPAFTGLGTNDVAMVEVAFSYTVGGQAEAGVIRYLVTGNPTSYEATIDFLGPAVVDQEVSVTNAAGASESLLDILLLGTADISETVSAVDFIAPTTALEPLENSLTLTIAGAYAASASNAAATASNNSIAMAAADDIASSATSVASDGSVARTYATDSSTVFAGASGQSFAEAAAAAGGVANAVAEQGSSALAVAFENSAASAVAEDDSDAQALAVVGSAADSDATSESSATATADNSSVATANADLLSTAVALSEETGSSTAIANDQSVASAAAIDTSIATAAAMTDSAASATATATSDALAFAEDESAADATATEFSSASVSAEAGAQGSAMSESFTAAPNTTTAIPVMVTADDFTGPVETVIYSGLPVGTILSAGTSNTDGTEWMFLGTPPIGLTLTPPLGFSGDINLAVTVNTETVSVSAVQTIMVS